MLKPKKVFRRVLTIEQALFDAPRWYLALDCGHTVWRMEREKPTVRKVCCVVCMAAETPLLSVAGQESEPS